jgi:hypothetical protein
MPKTLTFVHTSPVHVATFNALMAELAPAIPVSHIVNEELLMLARRAGGITAEVYEQVYRQMREAISKGAGVIVCTCSSLGGCAEEIGASWGFPILRIDRAMGEEAVNKGKKIIVAAALESTLESTREMLLAVAHEHHQTIELVETVCAGSWPLFEANDIQGYLKSIAAHLLEVADQGDVIVLAQASMADAAALCPDIKIPILSSPRLGVQAAIAAFQHRAQ